jgi:ABC-type antimicrobial peptide transport system permease subunit
MTLTQYKDLSISPRRLNATLISSFGILAVIIAAVGIAGVLAFSVSARTREFGIRLAIGSAPRHLLSRVLGEGAVIAVAGIVSGAAGGYVLARFAGSYMQSIRIPGVVPVLGAAALLVGAAVLASLMPASRASRIDVIQALRSD